jgi:Ca-activated chloride channel family protein
VDASKGKPNVKSAVAGLVLLLLALPGLARAEGFAWLRSENRNVREGNEKLAAGDQKAAQSAYDRAARELPAEGGVHLNRGLALMRGGNLPAAREALRLATQPPASSAVRADAYYNLGNAFYKEADARAGENKHDEAQQLFREAADAFKHSLRLRPGDPSTGWNHELSARRIREQEEKQKQEQDKNKQDKDKDKQDNDKQQDGNQQQDKDKQQDGNQQDKDKQQQAQDQQKKDQQQAPKPDQQKKDQQQQAQQDKQKKDEPQQAPAVRPEVDRALDALQDSEQNLERMRAMNRAARERRKPEKDW